jgi:hypothetical protein
MSYGNCFCEKFNPYNMENKLQYINDDDHHHDSRVQLFFLWHTEQQIKYHTIKCQSHYKHWVFIEAFLGLEYIKHPFFLLKWKPFLYMLSIVHFLLFFFFKTDLHIYPEHMPRIFVHIDHHVLQRWLEYMLLHNNGNLY